MSKIKKVALLLTLCLVACAPQPLGVTREPATLRLVAADSCQPLAERLAAAYEADHPWVTVHLQVFNNATAKQILQADEADAALFSWVDEADDEGSLWTRPFARDGIAVITHPTTPFEETGLVQLQEVFRGRVQEWNGVVLTVVSREKGSGTRAAFDDIVLEGRDTTLTAVVMTSNQAAVEYVARTPGAIGYVSTMWLDTPAASNVRVLPVENARPTPSAISDGSYPLSRSLYLATVGEPTGETREFAQWVLGPPGQKIAEQ